ncbi:MAG: protein phosphatase 2C domain-containing protein [Planctomycetota bacterium]|nr:protein phosphatase 2C domain-containing protein [Planctomycetota bacterium]
MFELNGHIRGSDSKCLDRAAWLRRGSRIVVAVADGAGKSADAGFAAEFAIKHAMKFVGRETSPLPAEQWLKIVGEIDVPLSLEPSGESTLVVADIGADRVTGASVGDSKAFLIDGRMVDLTANQQRQPLLGSGEAVVRAFESVWTAGTVLVCTDGLHKYAAKDKLVAAAAAMDPRAMIDLGRLPNGKLFDDAAAVLVRRGIGKQTMQEGVAHFIQVT